MEENKNINKDIADQEIDMEMDINSDADIPGTNHLTDELPENDEDNSSEIEQLKE